MKNTFKINFFFSTLLALLLAVRASAQTLPQIPETYVGNSQNITRLAIDSKTVNNCERAVMVWDGTNAALAWDDHCAVFGQLPLSTQMYYPEVLMHADAWVDRAMVIYNASGNIYIELFNWNTGYSSFMPPIPVTSNGSAFEVNADIDDFGRAVITWYEMQPGNFLAIKAVCFNLSLGMIGPVVDISTGAIPPYMQSPIPPYVNVIESDVAIATHGLGTNNGTVHFAYKVLDPNGETHLIYQVEEYNDLFTGQVLQQLIYTPAYTSPAGFTMGRPSIAAAWDNNTLSIEGQATVVFSENGGSQSFIKAYNAQMGAIQQVNNFGGTHCSNTNPVITATACTDQYVVAWEYYDFGNCNLPNLNPGTETNIIANQLDWISMPIGPNYQILNSNFNVPGSHEIMPAISGRFTTYNTIASVYRDLNGDIFTKQTPCTNGTQPYFRKQPASTLEKKIFPNPGTDQVQLMYEWDTNKRVQIRMVDMVGKVVFEEDLGFTDRVDWHYDTAKLGDGVYFIQLTVDGEIHSQKWLKASK